MAGESVRAPASGSRSDPPAVVAPWRPPLPPPSQSTSGRAPGLEVQGAASESGDCSPEPHDKVHQ
eukprot:14620700-Heterocapsa_arctica.AAC.1